MQRSCSDSRLRAQFKVMGISKQADNAGGMSSFSCFYLILVINASWPSTGSDVSGQYGQFEWFGANKNFPCKMLTKKTAMWKSNFKKGHSEVKKGKIL